MALIAQADQVADVITTTERSGHDVMHHHSGLIAVAAKAAIALHHKLPQVGGDAGCHQITPKMRRTVLTDLPVPLEICP